MKKYSLIIVSIFLCVLFFKLQKNYYYSFKDVEQAYIEGTAINLAKGIYPDKFKNVLLAHNYVDNDTAAQFISDQLANKINNEGQILNTLSDLQKRIWQVSASVIDTCNSRYFKEKLATSRSSLGIDSQYKSKINSNLDTIESLKQGNGSICIIVKAANDSASFLKKFLHKNYTRCSGVVVRLSKHYIDSLGIHQEIRSYVKTNTKGEAKFMGLAPDSSYSVIPICEGYEYGTPKGTIGGTLAECTKDKDNLVLTCKFTQIEHKIRLFDALTLKQIKEDKTITVRSPKEFKSLLTKYLSLFFGAWWGLYLCALRKKCQINRGILSILMFLTGFCLLTMFSINEPLVDKLLGIDMAQGIIAGIIVILLILNVDFVKLYQDKLRIGFDIPMECIKWVFKPFRLKVKYLTAILSEKKSNVLLKIGALLIIVLCLPFLLIDLIRLTKISDAVNAQLDKLPKGSGYLLVALLLTTLLFSPLGVAVGGMKVNLKLGILFQPSEIAKYLIIVFMAAYFSVNANNIVKYSEKGNTILFSSKLRMLLSIIIGLGILMGLYLVLGDMGPALVLAFTFIILYSIIKSKIALEGLSEQKQIAKILTCDLAMLIYGVISFIIFLCIGNVIGSMGIGCITWFVIWIIVGITKKQIFESPIFFNLILAAFIFGGSILSDSNISKLQSVGERLESRNEMCTNTWGTLPIDGMLADAGENTQVAEGLWGLASGGLWGQGLGNGSPHFIPAFHTDMILESIGEQLGFVGILVIIVLMALLLRKTIILGYKTSHPFAFYLCLGIAIVTAVQFVIISLGSTGIVPLTGVTVPFFSYGKVSMILNLAAFGIILSVSKHNVTDKQGIAPEVIKLRKQNIRKYNYSVSILSWVYCCVVLLITSVFFYYQFINRDEILIKPVYVNNSNGIPIIEYNPRIDELTKRMRVGDIYDRNGVLLATSDASKLLYLKNDSIYRLCNIDEDVTEMVKKRQKRYYPFNEHLFFMLGDYNSKLLFSANGSRGYMAESEHIDSLRGYDNKMYENSNKHSKPVPLKVALKSDCYRPNIFLSSNYNYETEYPVQLRNYEALIPYLKNHDKVSRMNKGKSLWLEFGNIEPQDIHLTLDAHLQTQLQTKIAEYVKTNNWDSNTKWNKLRISVVVLDAENGDLLASANYPLPNHKRLNEEISRDRNLTYQDRNREADWIAYTDMDLGCLSTAPGSTAKVVTSMAGLKKLGIKVAKDEKYRFYYDPIEKVGLDPGNLEGKWVSMCDAITWSSNNYVIKLLNTHDLYDELAQIYSIAGIRVNSKGSYTFQYPSSSEEKRKTEKLKAEVEGYKGLALRRFKEYNDAKVQRRAKIKNKKKGSDPLRDREQTWQWAWGQGSLDASPMAMARIASIVVNHGEMPATKFLLNNIDTPPIHVISAEEAKELNKFMKNEATQHSKFDRTDIGGKTGTPERPIRTKTILRNGEKETQVLDKSNDGWYICFFEKDKTKGKKDFYPNHLAVAVRMERLGSGMSNHAIDLTKKVVIEVLKDKNHKYID